MAEGFDPYLQWLGIRDPQRPPNHYRLLGIELFESDPDVISNAADRQMAHVRTFQAGRRSAESQQVLNELAGAKVCLLNPSKKEPYDAQLRAELGSAGPAASVLVSGEIRPPAIPVSLSLLAGRKLAVVWVALSALAAVGVVLAALLVFVLGGGESRHDGDDLARSEAWDKGTESERGSQPSAQPGTSEESKSGEATKGEPTKHEASKGVPAKSPGGEPPAKTVPVPSPKGEPGGDAMTKGVRPPPPMPGKAPDATPGSPMPSAPEPKSTPNPPVEPLPSFNDSIQAARAAMTARDPAAARKHVELAEKAAEKAADPGDQKRLARLHDVLDPWEAFWKAVREAVAGAKPGDVFQVDGRAIEVVQGGEESLTVRVDGTEKEYGLRDLPTGLALAIADAKLPDTLANISKAAFLLVDPQGDPNKGMEFFRQSGSPKSPGLNAELRQAMASKKPPPVPTPPPPAPLPRLPVPEATAQQAALKEVRDVHKARFAQARSPLEKGILASDLLSEAKETKDSPVARYVLLAEARDLAVAAGEPARLRAVVVEMATIYQVDALQEQARVLAEASESPMPSAVRASLAKAAIDLAEEAIRADAYDAAAQLAKAALSFATKVRVIKERDPNAIRQANELRDAIPWYKGQYELALQAEKALAQDRNNGKALLFLGRYYALVKDQWNRGLPFLLKSDDATLKPLAEAEQTVRRSSAPAAIVELADQWNKAAASMEEPLPRFARRRALHWYEIALPRLSGLTKERVSQTIEELKQGEPSRRKP